MKLNNYTIRLNHIVYILLGDDIKDITYFLQYFYYST